MFRSVLVYPLAFVLVCVSASLLAYGRQMFLDTSTSLILSILCTFLLIAIGLFTWAIVSPILEAERKEEEMECCSMRGGG